MICYPDQPVPNDANLDQKAMITKILEVTFGKIS